MDFGHNGSWMGSDQEGWGIDSWVPWVAGPCKPGPWGVECSTFWNMLKHNTMMWCEHFAVHQILLWKFHSTNSKYVTYGIAVLPTLPAKAQCQWQRHGGSSAGWRNQDFDVGRVSTKPLSSMVNNHQCYVMVSDFTIILFAVWAFMLYMARGTRSWWYMIRRNCGLEKKELESEVSPMISWFMIAPLAR